MWWVQRDADLELVYLSRAMRAEAEALLLQQAVLQNNNDDDTAAPQVGFIPALNDGAELMTVHCDNSCL